MLYPKIQKLVQKLKTNNYYGYGSDGKIYNMKMISWMLYFVAWMKSERGKTVFHPSLETKQDIIFLQNA